MNGRLRLSEMGSRTTAVVFFAALLLHVSRQHRCLVNGAKFTFINKCSDTIWPAILGSPKLETTGFQFSKDSSRVLTAPNGWSGRFWARTGCNFDGGSNRGSCATGDCGSGEVECNGSGATAATLAEFTLGSAGGDSLDFYDVSLVDGYNLPVTVEASGGSGQCSPTGCVADLNQKCPAELRAAGGGACRSACDTFGSPEYCCKGEYGSPATCKPSAYSRVFKDACPKSYSYAFDDQTSTFTCAAADYVITFCPSLPSQKSSRSDNNDEDGAGSNGSESGSGPGSVQEAIMADGSWLADLATGDSSRRIYTTRSAALVVLLTGVVHIAGSLVPFRLLLD